MPGSGPLPCFILPLAVPILPAAVPILPPAVPKLVIGQRPVARRDRAQDLRVQLDLIERHAVVDAQVDIVSHRVHLPWLSGYAGTCSQARSGRRGLA